MQVRSRGSCRPGSGAARLSSEVKGGEICRLDEASGKCTAGGEDLVLQSRNTQENTQVRDITENQGVTITGNTDAETVLSYC